MLQATNERYRYTQNREISWLHFNERVLDEASDISVPLLERLKFISIFSSNLDEFFMVRVGSLFDIASISPKDIDDKSGMTVEEEITEIYKSIPNLLIKKKQIYSALIEELSTHGIIDTTVDKLSRDDLSYVEEYFKQDILPILSPIIIGTHHPVPHIMNKHLYICSILDNKKEKQSLGIIPVPDSLPSFILLTNKKKYIRIENIILHYANSLFGKYNVKESCVLCVTRNADISFDDEKFEDNEEDFRRQVTKLLKKRDYLSVVRLELNSHISESFQTKLMKLFKVEQNQVFIDKCPLNMKYIFSLIDVLPKDISNSLLYTPYIGRWSESINKDMNVIPQIQKQDKLLFYPYDTVDPFLTILREAADNPNVLSIKITIYRLASSSKIGQILCRAAENGKEVTVLMELRARFDEANNLTWSKLLEEAGCQVIYGIEGYKCHSKICLITLRTHGKTSYITQIGTGNYNEKTCGMYTDLCYMTASSSIGNDAVTFFKNMLVNNLNGDYKELCVSPFGIKNMLIHKIDEQIKLGKDGYICIKANSVAERDIIDKLYEASKAGVEIQLIIRGICCILPDIPTYTENIHVTSIVGRYLEHARIYMFGKDDNAQLYISSADIMARNLEHRVEIACPIHSKKICNELKWILENQQNDTAKASLILPNGTYSRKRSANPFDSQDHFMNTSMHTVFVSKESEEKTLLNKIHHFFKHLLND